jgi:hypothetical protein
VSRNVNREWCGKGNSERRIADHRHRNISSNEMCEDASARPRWRDGGTASAQWLKKETSRVAGRQRGTLAM